MPLNFVAVATNVFASSVVIFGAITSKVTLAYAIVLSELT